MIPITILTGFLGAGKTTLLNKLIESNPEKKFGLIINEFGEVGIDGELVSQKVSDEQMFEITSGCICCVVRGDLIEAVDKVISKNPIDYLIIETSGLAEPMPVAQTFQVDNLGDRVFLDSVVTVVDCENFQANLQNYEVLEAQVTAAEIIVLNKVEEVSEERINEIKNTIRTMNEYAHFIENDENFNPGLLIETGKWTYSKIISQEEENTASGEEHEDNEGCCGGDCGCCGGGCCSEHEHAGHHNHEHEHVDEVVFTTTRQLDLEKFNEWVTNTMPEEIIRAKGFLCFDSVYFNFFLFQMVGSKKMLTPFAPANMNFDAKRSRVVFIGKNLPKQKILQAMESCVST